jgi:hypothetical protein
MKTICELKVLLKQAGFKGYSSLKKAELERLLESGTPSSSASKTPRTPRAKKSPKGDDGTGVFEGGAGASKNKPRKPRVAKPKPFTPAEVKGDTPVVAEEPIPRIVFPGKPPVLKPSKRSAMDKFFGGMSLIANQLPSPRRLPAPSMVLNMGKLIEGRGAQDAPFASPRTSKPPSARARVGQTTQYV